jgi:alpha-galactosidase
MPPGVARHAATGATVLDLRGDAEADPNFRSERMSRCETRPETDEQRRAGSCNPSARRANLRNPPLELPSEARFRSAVLVVPRSTQAHGRSPKSMNFMLLVFLALTVFSGGGLARGEAQAGGGSKPLKVFVLAGQSNMQGHAHVQTFDSLAADRKTAPLLAQMRDAKGQPRVCERVWISSVGCLGDAYSDLQEASGRLTVGFGAPEDKIGPEFTFGLTMERLLGEPILIIKTAWGGRSLHTDFRPPSAGPYAWSEYELERCKERGDDLAKLRAEKLEATGVYYREMIKHVKFVLADIKRVVPEYDPQQGFELAGFVWFQGFNDLVSDWTYDKQMEPGGYDLYAELLAHLIRDVRNDLAAPKLPVVIGVMGIGGLKEDKLAPQMHLRQAQLAPTRLPEFRGNVVAVETAAFWDDELEALQQRLERVHEEFDREAERNPKWTDEERDAQRAKAVPKEFSRDELKRLEGVSNGGYHYLGAAKIIAPIGVAFAEALATLRRAERPKTK